MTTRTLQTVAVARRRRRSGGFNVRRLFINGEAGGVYDPSDLTAEKVAWRRNQLTWSQDFTNAAWTKTNATLTANQGTAPDGTNTVTQAVFSGGAGSFQRRISQTPSVGALPAGTRFTFSIWARGNVGGESFVITDGWGSPTPVALTTTLTRYSWAFTAQGSSNVFNIQSETNNATVFLWGAQLDLGTTATAYQRITDFTSDFLAAFPTHGLYQDSAGTTPVTALGQPVGLVLDTSRGLALGSEQNGDPTLSGNGFFSAFGGAGGATPTIGSGVIAFAGAGNGASISRGAFLSIGTVYRFTFTVSGYGAGAVRFEYGTNTANFSDNGTFSIVAYATSASFIIRSVGASTTLNISSLSIRQISGVHAIQPTSASRPLLDGRVNLLTFSEQFDNAAWSKTAASVSANTSVAPDGTTTADTFTQDTTTNTHIVWRSSGLTGAGAYTYSTYLKASTAQFVTLSITDGASSGSNQIYATFDTVNGTVTKTGGAGYSASSVTSVGNGWYRCSVSGTIVTPVNTAVYVWTFQNTTGTPTYGGYGGESFTGTGASVLIWGADLRLAADAAYPYQRVAAATDYADVGVPRSFLFDGFDDSLYTASNMDLSGTDKVTVLAGVRKLSDAAAGVFAEFTANGDSTNGSFLLFAGPSKYTTQIRGTSVAYYEPVSYVAPITNVVALLGNIGAATLATEVIPRVDGVVNQSNSFGAAGTGNFTSAVLFIGRRNNATFPLTGKIYQLIVRGAATDAATLAQAERYVAQRTGITI